VKRTAIDGYADAAEELIVRYEAVSSSSLYSEVVDLLPEPSSKVIDIGAGTGRDAGWFAEKGCRVLAVEPVAAFRNAGRALHRSPRIEWIDDCLPALPRVVERAEIFDFLLLSAVWQHLDAAQRRLAMPKLRALTAPQGRLLMSVRHGPGAPTRPCFPASAEEAIEEAHTSGFRLVLRRAAASFQAVNRQAGVSWTWLAFSPSRVAQV
jgi:SAM-dependent methyltransferase